MIMIKMTKKFAWALLAAILCGFAACGGGGGSSSSTSTSGNSSNAPSNGPAATNGTISPSNPGAVPTALAANAVSISVSRTSFNRFNLPMVSVTLCTAGSGAAANCTTIDNVLLDTESFGLRLFASAIPATTLDTLNPQTQTSSGATIAECALFGSGYSWGTVRNADLRLGGEVAQNVPIQVMSDPLLSASAPGDCQQQPPFAVPTDLGANGILGLGVAPQDCGSQCVTNSPAGFYYACTSSNCSVTNQAITQQVSNPVQFFGADSNGIVVEMQPLDASGAQSASGTLVFGIDTQPNNTLAGSGATVLTTSSWGDFNANYNGTAYAGTAFFDSGSNVLFFQDASIGVNSRKDYVPGTTLARSVSIAGNNLTTATINFNVANANTLLSSGNYAFNDIASYMSGTFDMGLPFFFGRHVYYGMAGASSPGGGTGPYVAFTSS